MILAQPEVIVDPSIKLSISSNADPAIPGQAVKFSFQASAASGNLTPTGTVTFFDGTTQIGTPQTLAGGAAQVTISTLTVGSHTIKAVYSGDSTYSAGTVELANEEVGVPAFMQLNSSEDSSLVGDSVTFTFSALGNTGNPTPTGTVQFFDNGTPLGAVQTLSGGVATISTTGLTIGTHTITAQYSGDTTLYLPGTATLTPTQVVGTNALVQLSSSDNQSVSGAPVTFTFVANGRTGAPVPTGSVQFKDNGANVGAPQVLTAGGVASLPGYTGLAVGSHTITAVYSGDTYYVGQTATLNPAQVVIATPAPASGTTGIVISSSNDSSESGQGVTFTFTAYPPSGGAAATGNVQFMDTYNGATNSLGASQTLAVGAGAISTATVTTAGLGSAPT